MLLGNEVGALCIPCPLIRRVFYDKTKLRALCSLCLFSLLVLSMLYGGKFIAHQFSHGAGPATLFFVREIRILLTFFFATWIMGSIEGRSIAAYGLPWRLMFGGHFWIGTLLGFASLTCLLLAMRRVGVFHFGAFALRGTDIGKWALIYVVVFVLVALTEEFSARGYALYTLTTIAGFWPAAILTAIVFGYTHIGNPGEDWIGLVNVGLFGMLACLLLRRTGDLWMPIGLHMSWDWSETFFYGVANSGRTYPGQLMNSRPSGPAWVSGGSVGPEGSVLCTLLLVLCWILCSIWLPDVKYRRSAPVEQQGEDNWC
jgi:membrane protease YdiL (CAAX protease family)